MTHDRLSYIRVRGLRALAEVDLPLRGLTVLIGDNGTGKSTLLEALELMRRSPERVAFVADVVERSHGAFTTLLSRGSDALRLEVTVEGAGPALTYGFSIALVGTVPQVVGEWLHQGEPRADFRHSKGEDDAAMHLWRVGASVYYRTVAGSTPSKAIGEQALGLPYIGEAAAPAFDRILRALEAIEVHAPFETRPLWQARELDLRQGPRWPSLVERTNRLERYGVNLPNAFQQLRNLGGQSWERVMERARLGLGSGLRDLRLSATGRGNIELELVMEGFIDKPLPAEALSEGQVSYLAFIALCELHENRSVLVLDEPELHLHPALMARVLMMLERAAETSPVVLATHSNALLDALVAPAESVVLCELDAQNRVCLRRPDAKRLSQWLGNYRGLGAVRAEGYEAVLFDDEEQGES